MYSIIKNISVTANHLSIVLIGVLLISLRVNTIIFKMLAIVPNIQIYKTEKQEEHEHLTRHYCVFK